MQKMLRRTVTVGTLVMIVCGFVLIACAPAVANNGYTVDGMDGIVTLRDSIGNQMIVNAACARVIVDSGTPDLVTLHRDNTTALPAYIEACFD